MSNSSLQTEILETLKFFADTDIKSYGFLTKGTIEAFTTQKIEIPKEYEKYLTVELEETETSKKVNDFLGFVNGCDSWVRHSTNKNFIYTDTIHDLAELAQCFWLIDVIASIYTKLQKHDFSVLKLQVYKTKSGRTKAIFTADNGADEVYYQQFIEFTDFPIEEIKFYYTNNVLCLPSEY